MTEQNKDLAQDPVWTVALDWIGHVHAAPDDTDLRARLDAWLAEDPAHARAYARATEVWTLTGMVGPAKVVPFEPPKQIVVPRHRLTAIIAAGIAAVLVVAFAPRIALLLRADYRTGTGETRDITLADGSTLSLDADSAVAVYLGKHERRVHLLKGQALFRVRHDPTRPFTVRAGTTRISDIGTAFEVRLAPNDVGVSVESGVVAVRQAGMADERLGAGAQWRTTGAGQVTRSRIAPGRIGSWRQGRLIVQNVSVGEVVSELRAYRTGYIMLDDALARRQVTGIYDLHDPDKALESLVSPFHARLHHLTPFVVIVSAR